MEAMKVLGLLRSEVRDRPRVKGHYSLEFINQKGEVVHVIEGTNLVVDAGLNAVARRTAGLPETQVTHVALGTGGTAPAAGNTALEAEVGRVAVLTADMLSLPGQVRFRAFFENNQANGTLREVGLFNSAVAGTLYARSTFTAFTKDETLQLRVNYSLDFNPA